MDLSVKVVKITGGRFSLGKTGGHARPLVLEDVNLEVHDFSPAGAFPFTFATKVAGGGAIKLEGTAGPLDALDVAESPLTATFNVDNLDLKGAGILQSAPAIAGLIGLQAALESNGKSAHIQGKMKADKLKLAKDGTPASRAVEFAFTLDHDLRRRSGQLHQGEIKIGSAPASLTGSYADEGETTAIKMKLDGPKMPVPDLAAMLPAMGIVLPNGASLEGGTVSIKLAMEGPLERLVTSGTLSIDNTKLAGFDMGKKMALDRKVRRHQRRTRHRNSDLRRHPARGSGGPDRRQPAAHCALHRQPGGQRDVQPCAHPGFQNARHRAHLRIDGPGRRHADPVHGRRSRRRPGVPPRHEILRQGRTQEGCHRPPQRPARREVSDGHAGTMPASGVTTSANTGWWRSRLLNLYESLTRNDPVKPVDLIFVMAGKIERKHYGIELFRAGMAPRLVLSTGRFEVSKMSTFRLEGFDELIALRDSTPPDERYFYWKMDASGDASRSVRFPGGIPTARHWACDNSWKRKRRKP